jgi:uncharacterized protein (TIGR02145 family)
LDYEETQSVTTDEYGLVNVSIGAGAQAQASNSTGVYRSFDSILWNSSVKSLKVSVSYDGCSSFKQVSSQALTYTPYALYAESVEYKNVREAPTKLSQFSNDAGYLIPKDLDPLKNEITFNASQLAAANQTIADNKKSSDAAFLIVNQSITSLDVKVAENTSSIGTINTKITDQQNQISDNRNQITAANARLNDQQNQIAATNNSLNSQIGGLQGQINTESSISRAAELTLTNNLAALTNNLAAKTTSIASNTNDIDLKANIANPRFTGTVAVGTANPSTSAVLDINSTSQGMLVPRMTSTDRNKIVSPANALLIFNTSNNTFEVFKSTCSCWVTINDHGNTAASNLVNTAPTANSLNYIGNFRDGGTATIVYTYYDAQGDAQGATTLQWEIANDNTGTSKSNKSTSASVTFGPSDVGRYVRIKLTPRAATGILNGIAYYGEWKLISSSTVPYGSSLYTTGTVAQGSLLTGTYTFNGGSGVENSLGSVYNWQSATNNLGLDIQDLAIPETTPPQTIPTHTTTMTPLSTEIGKYVRFGVKARDNASFSATDFVYSNWVGPVTLAVEVAPVARHVNFSPANPGTNVLLTANYSYSDANEDPEGSTIFQWYTADDAKGTNQQTAIAGATAATFTITNAQANKFIGVGITPVAATGIRTGTQVVYYDPVASVGTANFTITGATQTSNNFYINRVMDASNNISVTINVTSAGTISFSTTTANGYSFSTSGTYTVGAHNVLLTATGKQTTYHAGGDDFTIAGVGATTQTITLTVSNVKIGADFTTHYNGITAGVSSNFLLATYTSGETFNNNSTCFSKPISTSSCLGSTVAIGSNTYSIANINGQCWMTQNMNELPNAMAINANEWLATKTGDLGFYGYYNTTQTNGTSGWAITVPAAGEGLLYQWSAAMLGSTTERAKGICPTGWHIPSDCEWMYLEHGQGMSLSNQVIDNNFRANTSDNQGAPGNKLRSAGAGQTNASGFSGLLVGNRKIDGTFANRSDYCTLWTSSSMSPTTAILRLLISGFRGVARSNDYKAGGINVRCLKD